MEWMYGITSSFFGNPSWISYWIGGSWNCRSSRVPFIGPLLSSAFSVSSRRLHIQETPWRARYRQILITTTDKWYCILISSPRYCFCWKRTSSNISATRFQGASRPMRKLFRPSQCYIRVFSWPLCLSSGVARWSCTRRSANTVLMNPV